jgi:glycosyltransferase involved in cell wall biosynthesis
VVLSTRNRGGRIVSTLASILANEHPRFEVIIVDQSDDDLTAESLQPYIARRGIRYVRTNTRGLGAARNLGIARAQSERVALTDDDCTVACDWLLEISRAFEADSRLALVFGNVAPGHHDRSAGFIPGYVREGTFHARSLADKHRVEGIGACMALQRGVWSELGGFDEMLGVGSPFRSAEDLDFALRVLQSGHAVLETDRVQVVHQGWRAIGEKDRLGHDYLYGIGAVYVKHLKCRRWSILVPLVRLGCRWAFRRPTLDYGVPPSRRARLIGFIKGCLAGTTTPVRRREALFANPSATTI